MHELKGGGSKELITGIGIIWFSKFKITRSKLFLSILSQEPPGWVSHLGHIVAGWRQIDDERRLKKKEMEKHISKTCI